MKKSVRIALVKKDITGMTIEEYLKRIPEEKDNEHIQRAIRKGYKYIMLYNPDNVGDSVYPIAQASHSKSVNKWVGLIVDAYRDYEEFVEHYK